MSLYVWSVPRKDFGYVHLLPRGDELRGLCRCFQSDQPVLLSSVELTQVDAPIQFGDFSFLLFILLATR